MPPKSISVMTNRVVQKAVLEDVGELSEDNDEKEQLNDEIRDFLKKSQMQIRSHRNLMIPGSVDSMVKIPYNSYEN